MSAPLVGHLEQSFFPSFTFINFTRNSSPALYSSIILEIVMNQNESVQSEKGSWAKFHTPDHTSGRRTGLSTDFDWNTSAESFIAVGHKAGVKIDKKPTWLFFFLFHFSPVIVPCYCFMKRFLFWDLFCKAVLCLAPSNGWRQFLMALLYHAMCMYFWELLWCRKTLIKKTRFLKAPSWLSLLTFTFTCYCPYRESLLFSLRNLYKQLF